MKFDNLHSDTNCDCLKQATVDTENVFVRKLRKETLIEKDFLSHWERGIGKDKTDCEEICSFKAVSVNIFKSEYQEQIVNKYKTTLSINPKKGAHYLKFKLRNDAGKIKFAPEDDDDSHYNFFKADAFDFTCLDIMETVNFF